MQHLLQSVYARGIRMTRRKAQVEKCKIKFLVFCIIFFPLSI